MKKQVRLLSGLALSISVILSASPLVQASTSTHVPEQQQAIPSLAPMLAKVLPAVVSVQVERSASAAAPASGVLSPFSKNGAPPRAVGGLGSGVIIDAKKGYLLTNNHVINQADKIKVKLNDGREFEAKTLGSDVQSDIALLQLQDAKDLNDIQIADSDSLRVGDFTVAVGNPFGLGQTATSGIISALGRSGLNVEGLENFIQTDAAINQGNSGGALVNLNGELIGINTAMLATGSGGGGNVGIGFAIPSNMAQTLARQFIQYGEVKRGLLGIKGTELNADIAKALNLNTQRGAFISEVIPDSGSAKAGVKAGDVITSLNDKTIQSFMELRSKIATTEPGTVVRLGLLRDNKPLNVSVTLDKSTESSANLESILPTLQGASFRDGPLKNGSKGILLDSVEKDSPAALIGLHKDDVIVAINREPVQNLADLRKIMATKPAIVALHVIRGDSSLYILTR